MLQLSELPRSLAGRHRGHPCLCCGTVRAEGWRQSKDLGLEGIARTFTLLFHASISAPTRMVEADTASLNSDAGENYRMLGRPPLTTKCYSGRHAARLWRLAKRHRRRRARQLSLAAVPMKWPIVGVHTWLALFQQCRFMEANDNLQLFLALCLPHSPT